MLAKRLGALAHPLHRLNPPPHALHRFLHLGHQRAAHLQRKIQPGPRQPPQRHVVAVVNQVDAATEPHRPVHHAQLAVQAPPAVRQQQPQRPQRRIHAPQHPGSLKLFGPDLGQSPGAHAIDHQMGAHAARCGAHQRLGHRGSGAGEVKDVGLELDVRHGSIHGLNQRREELLGALQQTHLVVVGGPGPRGQRKGLAPHPVTPPPRTPRQRLTAGTPRSGADGPTCATRCGHGARAATAA